MNEAIKAELAAMRTAYSVIKELSPSERRRAVMWLAAKLDVDLTGWDQPIALEALAVAEG